MSEHEVADWVDEQLDRAIHGVLRHIDCKLHNLLESRPEIALEGVHPTVRGVLQEMWPKVLHAVEEGLDKFLRDYMPELFEYIWEELDGYGIMDAVYEAVREGEEA